jgi:hypothetical protein
MFSTTDANTKQKSIKMKTDKKLNIFVTEASGTKAFSYLYPVSL